MKILCVVYNFASVFWGGGEKLTEFLLLCFNVFIHLKRFQVWINGSLVHIIKKFPIEMRPLYWQSCLTQQGASKLATLSGDTAASFSVSPIRSGFIPAVKRISFFGAWGQGVLLLKQFPPTGKENLGGTHTARCESTRSYCAPHC